MAATILLGTDTWDLLLDADGDIALATEPYSLAQDAASAILTYIGECFWDTTVGVPLLQQVFGQRPSIAVIKALFVKAALTVPDVGTAQVFITGFTNRQISGQVQVAAASTGQASAASFTAINPQGV